MKLTEKQAWLAAAESFEDKYKAEGQSLYGAIDWMLRFGLISKSVNGRMSYKVLRAKRAKVRVGTNKQRAQLARRFAEECD